MAAKTATRRAPARKKPTPAPEVEEIDELTEDEPEGAVEEETPKQKRRSPAKRKKAPEPEPVDEDEDDDLEDEDEEEEEPAPKKGKAKAKAKTEKAAPRREEPKYGTKWLAEHLSEKLGREVKSYDLRAVLRRMARRGELQREIGATRERYSFGGPKDPVVKTILEQFTSGAVDKDKKEKLAGLRKNKGKSKKAAEPEPEELEDEVEDLDDEEDEDDDDE